MKNYKNGEVINSYFSRLSFGLGSYCIIFIKEKNYIRVKIGEPMNPKSIYLIPNTQENIKEIKSLSQDFLSQRGFEITGMADRLATHYFENKVWHKY